MSPMDDDGRMLQEPRGACARATWSGVLVSAAVAILAASVGETARAQCQYAVVEPVIQGPNCQFSGPQPTIPLGMNNKGEVVGYYWNCSDANINHAFLWKPGVGLTTLPTPDGVASAFASDINDAGFIVGGHRILGVGWKGFILHPDTGEYTYLDALHDGFGVINTVSTANAINNTNPPAVAGSRVVSEPGLSPLVTNAVLWFPYGEDAEGRSVVADLGVANGPDSIGLDITDDCVVVGWAGKTVAGDDTRAILWQDGKVIDLGVLPGAIQSFARASNSNGWVVGGSSTGLFGSVLAAVWPNGEISQIPVPDGYATISLQDVNGHNQIVGSMRLSSPTVWHPFLWQHGKVHNLIDLLVEPNPGLTIERGRRANNVGHVLVRAVFNSKSVAVVLAPVDRPPTDLNADCVTNVHDLLLLLNSWGPCSDPLCPADLTGNGAVGVQDLLTLLANWG